MINLRHQKVWGLCAHLHQINGFFYFLVVLTSEKKSENRHEILLSGYFRGYEGGVSPLGRQYGVLLSYMFIALGHSKE